MSKVASNYNKCFLKDICERRTNLLDKIIGIVEKHKEKYTEERRNHPDGAGTDKLYQRIGRAEAASNISKEILLLICKDANEILKDIEN